MRSPEEIEKEINRVEKELKLLRKEQQEYTKFKKVCDGYWSKEMIGFFNIGNTKLILGLLNSGKELQYRHGIFGDVTVCMNPQRNRILVSKNEEITEDNIMSFIIWHSGEWWINSESLK